MIGGDNGDREIGPGLRVFGDKVGGEPGEGTGRVAFSRLGEDVLAGEVRAGFGAELDEVGNGRNVGLLCRSEGDGAVDGIGKEGGIGVREVEELLGALFCADGPESFA